MLVSDEPIRRPVPHEQYEDDPGREGEWFEFRILSGAALRKAREAKNKDQRKQGAEMLRVLGPKFLEDIGGDDPEKKKKALRGLDELEYHISQFDETVLLREGVISWSYDGGLPHDCQDPSELLDEKTARWAAQEVVSLTRPPDSEEEGNDSSPSVDT